MISYKKLLMNVTDMAIWSMLRQYKESTLKHPLHNLSFMVGSKKWQKFAKPIFPNLNLLTKTKFCFQGQLSMKSQKEIYTTCIFLSEGQT